MTEQWRDLGRGTSRNRAERGDVMKLLCKFLHKWSRWEITISPKDGRFVNHRWCHRCRDIQFKKLI